MSQSTNPAPGATTAQLKADIDAGLTGDKVPEFDLAAAPLGTDDEAGGTPPSPEVIAHARESERQFPRATQSSSGPAHESRPRSRGDGSKIWLLIVAVAAILLFGMYWVLKHA
jgi:hypothetical protein